MIIKKVSFGNNKEAFVEDSLSDKYNIIYSFQNNKGKTILIQSIIYALGGDAMFPQSFNYKDFYFYIVIENQGNEFVICRKKNSFTVKSIYGYNIFDSYAEYRYYFDKKICPLPKIIKDGKLRVADINLLCELFFIPQTNRNTSNIISYGYYRKQDFENLLYALAGISSLGDEEVNVDELKEKIKLLQQEQNLLRKENKLLTSKNSVMNYSSSESHRLQFEEKLKNVELIKNKISEMIKQRNRSINDKIHDEMLLQELTSLDRKASNSELVCLDCGSKNIGYTTSQGDYTFDVSDKNTRNEILASIKDQIEISEEEIKKLSFAISEQQHILQDLLRDDDVNLKNLLIYKKETVDFAETDKRLDQINTELLRKSELLKIALTSDKENKQKMAHLMDAIINEMQEFYLSLEPNGNSLFNNIYTTQSSVYSGSEETEFYLAKLYAYAKHLNHNFPIIVDGYREGEIDSDAEKIILNKFLTLPNQIIFTATLKVEEYNHYDMYNINSIDYSIYDDSHILNPKFTPMLKKQLEELGIIM